MKTENEIKMVIAGTLGEAEFVKGLSKDSEIDSFLKDEFMGYLAPWQASPGGVGSVKVIVSELDYMQAKQIVDAYKQNRSSNP